MQSHRRFVHSSFKREKENNVLLLSKCEVTNFFHGVVCVYIREGRERERERERDWVWVCARACVCALGIIRPHIDTKNISVWGPTKMSSVGCERKILLICAAEKALGKAWALAASCPAHWLKN